MTEDWTEFPNSSNIAKARYVDGAMEVEFNGGAAYRYEEVPQDVFDRFCNAESVGRFFQKEIRGKYAGEKIEGKKGEE